MLQSICEHLNNYFIESRESGEFTADGGMISPAPDLKEGQRFWLVGSGLNDGVYTYHASGITNDDDDDAVTLKDEQFYGTICAMAVPNSVLKLSSDIKEWQDKYGEIVATPYSSESIIGVYSYQKTGGGGPYNSGVVEWQTQFKSRLNRWRKICV